MCFFSQRKTPFQHPTVRRKPTRFRVRICRTFFAVSACAPPLAAYPLFHTPVGGLHSPGIYTKNPYTSYL